MTKREEYHKKTNLFIKQNWLINKKGKLEELIKFCAEKEKKELIFSLLERFNYLNIETLGLILNDISDYIINESGFNEETTQLLSLTYDDEADSSQKILDNIKNPLFEKGWRSLKTVNQFGKSRKNYTNGKTQIVIIDEFIGSGQTLRVRIDYLDKSLPDEYELICCFIAGIKETISDLEEEGIKLFCPLQLDKGITGFYKDEELKSAVTNMLKLEEKLAQKINENKLTNYSFGWGKAEALITMEGCLGNTPNSVFPIFWWLKDIEDNYRNTLLTRVEKGF